MTEKIDKLEDLISQERNYVYNKLLYATQPKEYKGIGEEEEHITLDDDKECKGALKTLDFILLMIEKKIRGGN